MEIEGGFPALKITRKTGKEIFSNNGKPLNFNLLNFWQWSVSDLISNATRGILAEYIVATALGLADGFRVEWDAFDLLTANNTKIEIKSAAYLQSWHHQKLSDIRFSIRPTQYLSSTASDLEIKRQADIYVFCLLHHQEKDSIDPMNLDQWEFYILRSLVLNEMFPKQKTIGLKSLLKANPLKANYNEIKSCIEQLTEVL